MRNLIGFIITRIDVLQRQVVIYRASGDISGYSDLCGGRLQINVLIIFIIDQVFEPYNDMRRRQSSGRSAVMPTLPLHSSSGFRFGLAAIPGAHKKMQTRRAILLPKGRCGNPYHRRELPDGISKLPARCGLPCPMPAELLISRSLRPEASNVTLSICCCPVGPGGITFGKVSAFVVLLGQFFLFPVHLPLTAPCPTSTLLPREYNAAPCCSARHPTTGQDHLLVMSLIC